MENIIIPLLGLVFVEGYYLYEFAKQNKHLIKGYNNVLDIQNKRYIDAINKISELTDEVKKLEHKLKQISNE